MLPSSPRRFGLYICTSLIFLNLLLSYSTHCMAPSQHCLGIFPHDFSSPFNMRLRWAEKLTPSNNNNDNESNPFASPNMFADIIPTAQNSNNNDTKNNNDQTSTTIKDLGVENLYEYALKSASFRDEKDVKTLRQFLQQSNAQKRSSYRRFSRSKG